MSSLARSAPRVLALTLGCGLGLAAGELTARLLLVARHGTATDRAAYSGRFIEPHEHFGWLGIPGARVRHRTTEFDVEIAIHPSGLRQADPPPLTRTDRRRICALGDSFVFGQGVRESERVSERLAGELDAEVCNLALPAIGTDQELLLYRDLEGPHRTADVVLLFFFPENVRRNGAFERHGMPKPRFVLESGTLRERAAKQRPMPASSEAPQRVEDHERGIPIPFKATLQRHSALYLVTRRALAERLRTWLGTDRSDPYPEYGGSEAWEVTRAILGSLADVARERGARPALVIVPEVWHLREQSGSVHQRVITRTCDELGVPVLDLTPVFTSASPRRGRELYHAADGHWNAMGHAFAAKAVAAFVRERGLLD